MIAISYRREDSLPVAGRVYDRLEQRFGKDNVFMDFDSIRPGFDFRDQIKETIEKSKVVVVLIGPHWLGEQTDGSRRIDDPNDFVRVEVVSALKRGIPVIPVLINDTHMPKPETLPPDMQAVAFRHALPLDTGLDFRQHADRLTAAIQGATTIHRSSKLHKRKFLRTVTWVSSVSVFIAVMIEAFLFRSPSGFSDPATSAEFNTVSPQADTNRWSYRYKDDTTHDGNYTLLPAYTHTRNFTVPIGVWNRNDNEIPHVGLNLSGNSTYTGGGGVFTWPNGALVMHPGRNELVVLSWLSPEQRRVWIRCSFTSINRNGGNGIKWSVDQNATPLKSGQYGYFGKSGWIIMDSIPVNAGDRINFIVDPNGDYQYDSTQVRAYISYHPWLIGPAFPVGLVLFIGFTVIIGMIAMTVWWIKNDQAR
jgi:hypothetical protein